jgi:PAS domain S-box-containing protein
MDPELPIATPHVGARSYFPPTHQTLSAADYAVLVEHSPVMIWRAKLDSRCDYFNDTWLAFTGRTLEEEVGDGSAADVHPDDLAQVAEGFLDAFHKHENFEMEYRLRRHDGIYRWIVNRGAPVFGNDGTFQGFVGSCTDIDDRRRARIEREAHLEDTLNLYHELRAREAKIRRLIDSNIVGVVFSDLDSRIIEANDAFLDLTGYTRDDVAAGRLHWRDLTPVEWREVSERAVAQLLATETCDVFEKEYFRRDGSRVPVLVGAAALGEARTETVAFILDRTEAKRSEHERERLRQAQADLVYMNRVLTMGELAASIAHDIKQPITAALASAEICLRELDHPLPDIDGLRDAATVMSREVTRATEILDRLRALYTRGAPRQDPVDMNDLVNEMVALLDREATVRRVPILTELDPTLPPISGDRVQLQQVLLNLMLNALEATHASSGELSIRTQRHADGHVEIAVTDSGIGLPAEHGERVFDAFFTTKPQGIGMGLAISRAIVEAHGGALWATANPTAGTTFRFILPN